MKTIKALTLFHEYRRLTEQDMETYNNLKTMFPYSSFPKIASRLWRRSVLAETWGAIATALNGNRIDYLEQWRNGL